MKRVPICFAYFASLLHAVVALRATSDCGSWIPQPATGTLEFQYSACDSISSGYKGAPQIGHRVGNDMIETVAFTDGTVSLRQDEGGPLSRNGLDVSAQQWRGGNGYFHNKSAVLGATSSPGVPLNSRASFDLSVGVGSVRKHLRFGSTATAAANHTVWAPFGDVPAIVSQIDINTFT